jgi:hypothetical protein
MRQSGQEAAEETLRIVHRVGEARLQGRGVDAARDF